MDRIHSLLSMCLAGSFLGLLVHSQACSVFYYFDEETGIPYVANMEDYWMDQAVDLLIMPASRNKYARMWYGWDNFAQGGVNEHGLFFDGATTPESMIPEGYRSPRGNLGDRLLAQCTSVEEAIAFLEHEKVALTNAHMMVGDRSGKAVVVSWIASKKHLTWISDGTLTMTNTHLVGKSKEEIECPRYQSIQQRLEEFHKQDAEPTLLIVGNMLGAAAQPPRAAEEGRLGGTLYSTFLDLKNMVAVFVPKLDNSQAQKIDLAEAFSKRKKQKLKFD